MNSFKVLGKTPGKDKKQGKRTLLSVLGKPKAINYCEEIAEKLIIENCKEFNLNPTLKKLLYYNIKKLK